MPQRPTFGQALNTPGLTVAIGKCARSELAAAVNEAQELLIADELAPDEGWWGSWVTAVFNVTVNNFTGEIITPREIARIIVLDVCKRPRPIRNGFYEYLQFGNGAEPKDCNTACRGQTQAFERDTIATLTEFPTAGPRQIRLFATNAGDLGKRVVLQGPDSNGNTVYSMDPVTGQSMLGEVVFLNTPFSVSANSFQGLTGLIKDVTLGPVQVFTIDPATGQQVGLTTQQPTETTAAYRRYFLNGLPANCCNTSTGLVQVMAQCKLDFIPVINDSDYLIIQSIPAIIDECASRRYSRMDSAQAHQFEKERHEKAIRILNGQLDHVEGKINTAISVPLFGSDRLRPQPK